MMGLHLLLASTDAEADRAFLRDVLAWPSVEAGPGWLIFKTPPTELAVHPADEASGLEAYLMCEDLDRELARLSDLGVPTGPVSLRPYGRVSSLTLPSGAVMGLYQPTHPLATEL
jgi:hypothetical protein